MLEHLTYESKIFIPPTYSGSYHLVEDRREWFYDPRVPLKDATDSALAMSICHYSAGTLSAFLMKNPPQNARICKRCAELLKRGIQCTKITVLQLEELGRWIDRQGSSGS